MKKSDSEQIDFVLKELKRKILIEVDEAGLIDMLTKLSNEIEDFKKEKESLEKIKKLLDVINSDYAYAIGDYNSKINIPKLKKDIDTSIKELVRQIMYKSEKFDKYKLLFDFISNENFI